MSREEIAQTLSLLFPPGSVVELRALRKAGGMASGYYTDYTKLAHDAEILDSTKDLVGMYIILNKINPVLFSRRANRIEMRLSKDEKATSDEDIMHRWWFPIDIDPVRPSGISSSDEEHNEALRKAEKIRGFLSEMGWPDPISADSGNGAHLLYHIDLPNDPDSANLIKQALTVLSAFFSDEKSGVDISVSKAAQLWKLYGTMAKKGDSVLDRPYRRSRILSSPENVDIVGRELLIQLASLLPSPPEPVRTPSRKQSDILDLGIWLSSHGLFYREKPYGNGRLFLFDQCPFSSAHADGAYAIQFDNGAIFAGCHHNSCGGGEQRWSELRERFDGPQPKQDYESRLKQQARERAKAKAEYYGNIPERCPSERKSTSIPAPDLESHDSNTTSYTFPCDIPEKATEIIQNGDPVAYLKKSIAVDHEGDDVVASCLIMSFASISVLNSNGLHVLVTGESGKGKSHIFDTMIQHVPPEERLDGRLSDKALYYTEGLKPGTAICLDDVTLSEAMQETLKGVTTSFKKPFLYRTVNKDRKGQVCIIPERCVWWVAKVNGTGDDQVWNRMLTCWIDDSSEQDEKVLERELAAAEEFPEIFTETREEVLVSHEIWKQVKPVYVVIPFAKRIRFTSSTNLRNPGMLLDLIKSHTALHQYQRQKVQRGNVDVVIATEEDFDFANQIYQALNSVSGGQNTKLTKSESLLIESIRKAGRGEYTMKELQDLTNKSYESIRKLIRGSGEKSSHNGLLEKCPAITYLYRTDMTDTGNRSQLVYIWNEVLYQIWSAGGGCWLSRDGNGNDNRNDNEDNDEDGDVTENIPQNTDTVDAQPDTESGKPDLITGETGERQRATGEKFSPPKEEQNEEYSQNNKNNNRFYYDRRKNPDAEKHHDPLYGPLSSPGSFLQSDEKVDTKTILDSVRELEEKSPGEKISPVFSDQPVFSPVTPVTPVTHLVIDPDDYGPINGVWSGPCAVCGGKWVHYTEKFSPHMKAEGRFSHKICQKCYDRARLRKSGTYTALPGLLNINHMIMANKDLGRCDVCNTGAAIWIDPDTKQKICQVCYTREQDKSRIIS
ncbi:hypothetical protein KHC33_10855 [Methanospirillum sp. J.3.6.1-F.2.7.3]|uniref:Uncharacterized protein n=1 Tax=Methanospirillum purgamenti TaxID=2834276 RepID=A0A8E7EG21_9EURY|nr:MULTISPECIES: hypothetical protein [Methanospirillum]MDX8551714.1 hypothetical protein [Methanospirillum hungatei]QVV87838.1 hypothetical protein KHC33_10855 [Methanospirillum sp. J.3.6.1-F.2.7.3]